MTSKIALWEAPEERHYTGCRDLLLSNTTFKKKKKEE